MWLDYNMHESILYEFITIYYMRLQYNEITITIQRDNNHSVFRIYHAIKNYELSSS